MRSILSFCPWEKKLNSVFDSKEREYIVVSMTPRDSKTSESISAKINHLP